MSTEDTTPEDCDFSPYEVEEIQSIRISPKGLPEYRGEGISPEIEAAFELLYENRSAEEFYKAVALLVFHARHLRPDEHSKIATLIQKPYKRRRGKLENLPLNKAAYEYASSQNMKWFAEPYPERQAFITKLAHKFDIDKETARRTVVKAEKRVKKEADLFKQKVGHAPIR